MASETCISCGLCQCTGYNRPWCTFRKAYVWASGSCPHWQAYKPGWVQS